MSDDNIERERFSVDPVEGVDYIVDYYAIAGIDEAAREHPETFGKLIKDRLRQYHPDLLQGRAPEFLVAGERMTVQLNRALAILTDPDKRQLYDDVLASWTGLLSDDGIPAMTFTAMMARELAHKTPDEIEDNVSNIRKSVGAMAGYDEKMIADFTEMLETMGDNTPASVKAALRTELGRKATHLAVLQPTIASQVLGLRDTAVDAIGEDYASQTTLALDRGAERYVETITERMQLSGGAMLALLAGEQPEDAVVNEGTAMELLDAVTVGLDRYRTTAAIVTDIAEQRVELLQQRLALIDPIYPEGLTQDELKNKYLVGVILSEEETRWFGLDFDAEALNLEVFGISDAVKASLEAGDYKTAVEAIDATVLFLEYDDNIDLPLLISSVVEKHIAKNTAAE